MSKKSRPGAADVAVRRSKSGRAGSDRIVADAGGIGPAVERGGVLSIDGVGFAIFAGYLVLAFTRALPDQFALPKLLGLYVYAGFCAVRWAVALRQGRVNALPPALWLATLALACWWTATTFTAQHLNTALFGMRGRYNGLATMLAGLALFLIIGSTRATAREIEQRLKTICVALTLASGYGLVQASGLDVVQWPEGRPPSTLGHPVIFAGALAMGLPFALTFALDSRSRVSRLAWGGMALAQGLALTLTLARGPWIAAVCGLVLFATLAVRHRRALAPRLAAVAVGAVLVAATVLAVSPQTRQGVLGRVSTITRLAGDSSLLYRAHFYRAALAMLRDHSLVGVGWENFGLLYPVYRSSPTESIASDLVPTMVHSDPLQTAVSGGIPALVLQVLFFGAAGAVVIGRRRRESDAHQRLLGAAFLASAIAYLVQGLSGWPHVALDTLALLIWGVGISWSLSSQPRAFSGSRWPLVLLASAVGIGGAWTSLETWKRIRAERLVFEAQSLDVRKEWSSVERKLRTAIDSSPDKAWANDAAARLYLRRVAATGDRRAYDRGVELTNAARAANSFDPYIRLRRTELDVVAANHGLNAWVTDDGRDALTTAKSMTAGSAVVQKVEASLARKGGNILWIQPQPAAGFGPPGSLVVAGSAPRALTGTHVFFHWRNVTRASEWTTEPHASTPDGRGTWYHAIPNANFGEKYEVYATSETWYRGPCAYPGNGSIQLCSPLALIKPVPEGAGPPGSLVVSGSVPEAWAQLVLHWRNETRQSAWNVQPFRSTKGVAFPPDAPGNWYRVLPDTVSAERYQAYLSSPTKMYEPCTYAGDGSPAICSPIGWIQPQALAGFGPPGSLLVAGLAPRAWGAAPVFLHWRNATRRSAWTTEAHAATPDARGIWYNAIPNANLNDRYEVYITSPTTASDKCTYAGDGFRNVCP